VWRSLEAGADLHVSKPVQKATLLAAIESVMLASSGPMLMPSAQAEPAVEAAPHAKIVA
jgi:DNA-binding response OmpR family regulator